MTFRASAGFTDDWEHLRLEVDDGVGPSAHDAFREQRDPDWTGR